MAVSALASAAGRPSRVLAERDTTSTFQPPARNMAMMPTPMVPPPMTSAWCSLCDILDPPAALATRRAPDAGAISPLTRKGKRHERHLQGYRRHERWSCRGRRDPAAAPQLLRQFVDQPDRR